MTSVEDDTFRGHQYVRFLDDAHKQIADVSHEGGNSKAIRVVEAGPRLGRAEEFVCDELHFGSSLSSLLIIG